MALSATRDTTGYEAADSWDGDPTNQVLDAMLAKLEVDSAGRPIVILQERAGFVNK